ncbi:MAG TPA: hypothetical protein PL166_13375 [Candidatus Contendobacter sp.]|nr:hypothetical protein [Candidatus Contendobacter sp.]
MAGIYLPNRLILPLCAGCFVLFALFVISPPKYNNFEPLFTKSRPEIKVSPAQEENSNPAEEKRKIAVRVLGMEIAGKIPDADDNRRIWLMQQRVGTNIFIRSGYLQSASFVTLVTENPPPHMQYKVVLEDAPVSCAYIEVAASENNTREEAEESDDIKPASLHNMATRLAISAVAVEKFHRNVLHRRMEWAYAQAFSALSFGRLPDVSLGPAQIRVSSVRKIAAEVEQTSGPYAMLSNTSDADLKQILFDECKSLKLAATMMYHFLRKARCEPDNEDDPSRCLMKIAAETYVGKHRKTSAVIDYSPIVVCMAEMLSPEGMGM